MFSFLVPTSMTILWWALVAGGFGMAVMAAIAVISTGSNTYRYLREQTNLDSLRESAGIKKPRTRRWSTDA